MTIEKKGQKELTLGESRKLIYEALKKRHGSFKKIEERTGFHRTYVSSVLRQEEGYNNNKIWKTAIELLEEYRNKESEIDQLVKETAQSLVA